MSTATIRDIEIFAPPPMRREKTTNFQKKALSGGARHSLRLRDLMLNGTIKGFLIFGEDFAMNTEYAALLTQAEHVVVVDMFELDG